MPEPSYPIQEPYRRLVEALDKATADGRPIVRTAAKRTIDAIVKERPPLTEDLAILVVHLLDVPVEESKKLGLTNRVLTSDEEMKKRLGFKVKAKP